VTSAPQPEHHGLFDRLAHRLAGRTTEPIADRAKERIGRMEDRVRSSVMAEIDAVSRSVRARAVQVRPSAIAFAVAAVLTVLALALMVGAAVVGLAHVLPLWLALLIVGVALLLLAAGAAAWGRNHLPPGPVLGVPPAPMPTHPAEELVHPWAD